jgi:hypothetical protein
MLHEFDRTINIRGTQTGSSGGPDIGRLRRAADNPIGSLLLETCDNCDDFKIAVDGKTGAAGRP